MVLEKVKVFMLARDVLLAIKDKKALSEFSHKIDELFEKADWFTYFGHNCHSYVDMLILWAAETFSEADGYTEILNFLEQKGLSDKSFKQHLKTDEYLYLLSKYYTLPDDMDDVKEHIYYELKNMLSDDHFNNFDWQGSLMVDFLSILPMCLTDDKRLINDIYNWWHHTSGSEIYACSCILDKKTDALKCAKIDAFRFQAILELLLNLSEDYYEFIQENFISAVPVIFKKNKTTLRKKEELVPFLFKSKRTKSYISDDDDVYLVRHLYKLLKKEVFEEIFEYVPEITHIYIYYALNLAKYETDLKKALAHKLGKRVVIYNDNEDNSDISTRAFIDNLNEEFPDTSFVIGYSVLKNEKTYPGSLIDFMEDLSVDDIVPDTDDLHTELVDINGSDIISHAVRLKIINQSNIEECIRYAVENRCTDALFRLNSEYKNLSE
ncbi:MAG: hypothetical protein IJA12_04390 [Oscillospiraceae bacterium]|nr:hypothetical protein [Oscillospiraceae bacterium]